MMHRFLLLILATSSFILPSFSIAQSSESVLINLDKPYYLAGDSIYFNSFLMNSNAEKLGGLSDVYYLEVYSSPNELVAKFTGKAINGYGTGMIKLPPNLFTGTYLIVAYTKWMLQFNQRDFFKKSIEIFGKEPYVRQKISEDSLAVDLWPEGAAIIDGISNTVGYQIQSANGDLKDVHGFLIDHNQDTLLRFSPQFKDLGYFNFRPIAGSVYTVSFIINEQRIIKSLSKFRSKKHAIKLIDTNSENLIVYCFSKDVQAGKTFRFQVDNGGVAYLKGEVVFNEGKIGFSVPRKALKSGFNFIKLYNTENEIVASKAYYNKVENSNVSIAVKNSVFNKHSKIVLPLKVNISDSTEYLSSISIKKKSFYPYTDSFPISSSDHFFEAVKNEEYKLLEESYAINDNKFKLYLMAFDLNNNADSKDFKIEKGSVEGPELSHDFKSISGVINLDNECLSKKEIDLICTVSGLKESAIYSTTTNENGEFLFLVARPNDEAKIVISPIIKNTSCNYNFSIDEHHPEITQSDFKLNKQYDEQILKELVQYSQENQIINRNYNFLSKKEYQSTFNYKPYFENYDFELDLKLYIDLNSFAEVCKELIPGIKLTNSRDIIKIYLKEKQESGYQSMAYKQEPLFLIDGIPVSKSQLIYDLAPETISMIRLINQEIYINDTKFFGVIEITTRNDGFCENYLQSNSPYFESYKAPKVDERIVNFSDEFTQNKINPNFRNLMYWNPKFVVNNRTQFIELNSGDDTGSFILEMNGVNSKGKNFHYSTVIEIKETVD